MVFRVWAVQFYGLKVRSHNSNSSPLINPLGCLAWLQILVLKLKFENKTYLAKLGFNCPSTCFENSFHSSSKTVFIIFVLVISNISIKF